MRRPQSTRDSIPCFQLRVEAGDSLVRALEPAVDCTVGVGRQAIEDGLRVIACLVRLYGKIVQVDSRQCVSNIVVS